VEYSVLLGEPWQPLKNGGNRNRPPAHRQTGVESFGHDTDHETRVQVKQRTATKSDDYQRLRELDEVRSRAGGGKRGSACIATDDSIAARSASISVIGKPECANCIAVLGLNAQKRARVICWPFDREKRDVFIAMRKNRADTDCGRLSSIAAGDRNAAFASLSVQTDYVCACEDMARRHEEART
jgi:hypothetical protein